MKLKRILAMIMCLCMVLSCMPAVGVAAEEAAASASADVFGSSADWDIAQQGSGILAIPSSDGDSGWIETVRKDYTNVDFRLTLRDQVTADANFRVGVRLYFTNDASVTYSITNDRVDDDDPAVYELQTMGGTILNWKDLGYDLTADQVTSLTGEQGLEFRVVLAGTVSHVYLGGDHIYEYDLGDAVAGELARVVVRCYGNTGKDITLPFSLSEDVEGASLSIDAGENGTVTAPRNYYLVGEKINLTVTGNDGYAHDSFTVNGAEAMTDNNGAYSFTAQKENSVTATFAPNFVTAPSAGWALENQHYGKVQVIWANTNGNSNWLNFVSAYTNVDVAMQAKEYVDASKPDLTRSALKFTFTNGKIITFSIAKNVEGEGHKYSIQSLSGDSIVAANYDFYVMNAQEIAKFNSGEGIGFRVIRQGTLVDIYLDGVLVVDDFDLTQNESGVTADMEASLSIRRFDDPDIKAEYGLTVSTDAPQAAVVNVDSQINGSISLNKESYIVGEKVTVTVKANTGYAIDTLTLNGETVTLGSDGTYSFYAQAENTLTAGFRTIVFGNSAEWDNSQQESGILMIPASDGDSGWIETNRKDYTDVDFRLMLRDYANADDNFRAAIRLYFSNDQYVSFTVTNDRSNDDETTVYELQTMGDTILNWKYLATLTADQVAKLTGNEGLEFRVVRVENMLYVYAGGVRIYEYDMTGVVSTETCSVVVRCYGNTGKDVELPFSLSEDVHAANLSIDAGENGTVTADQTGYFVGDTVTLTVAGNAGFAHDSLTVNGSAVKTDIYGKYSFEAKLENTVSATFAASLFKDSVSGWLLENQHYGEIAVSYTNANGHSNWGDLANAYGDVDITLVAREYEDASKPDLTRSAVRFMFTNGKVITFSIAKNTDKNGQRYSIQSLSGDNIVAANYDFYMMNAEQIEKFNSAEGIALRVVRQGTVVDIYLDNVLVVNDFDLTQNESGVTAETETNLTLRRYDDPGIVAVYGFCVSEVMPQAATVTVESGANGTVTTDRESYIVGEQVTITVAGATGYAHDSLTVNGEAVTTDNYGKYTFTAAAENTVTATFKASLFNDANSGWYTENQHYGKIMVGYTNANGHSNWLNLVNSYGDMDITLVAREYEDTSDKAITRSAIRFTFTGGEMITFSIAKNKAGESFKYSVQTLAGDTIVDANTDLYVMNETQIAKFLSEDGIALRVVRTGTTVNIYLDGELVVEGFDLTQNGSGVTAGMAANVGIRRFDDPGIAAEYGLSFSGKIKLSTVYVSSTGSDDAIGTEAAPVASLEKAVEIVEDNGTVHIVDTVAGAKGLPTKAGTVTITGGTLDLSAFTDVWMNSGLIFDNVTINFQEGGYLYANGHPLTVNENVTFVNHPYVFGGGKSQDFATSELNLYGGDYLAIYGGGRWGKITDTAKLTIGGVVNHGYGESAVLDHDSGIDIFGGGLDAYTAKVELTFGGNALARLVYGAGTGGNSLTDETHVYITGGKMMGAYGGGAKGCDVGNANLTMTGGLAEQIYGGNETSGDGGSLTGDVHITVLGGEITRRLAGGCYNGNIAGTVYMILGEGLNYSRSYGAGLISEDLTARCRTGNTGKAYLFFDSEEAMTKLVSELASDPADNWGVLDVKSWNLILNGDIGMNFQIAVGEGIRDIVTVEIVDGDSVVTKTPAELLSGDYCVLQNHKAAAQMTDEITVSLKVGSVVIQSNTYSVRQYADYILNPDNGFDDKTVALVKEMLNYGAAAQNYFSYNTGNSATADLDMTGAGAQAVPNSAKNDLSVSGSAEGICFYGASLVFESKTAVRFYFTGSADGIEGAVIKGDMFYVEVADILPQNLDEAVIVAVGGLTVSYSPMNYIVRMNAKGSESLQALLQAMYNYHLTAKAY